MIYLSIAFGWLDCLLGLSISYWFNVPSGASIIFISIVIYALSKAFKTILQRTH